MSFVKMIKALGAPVILLSAIAGSKVDAQSSLNDVLEEVRKQGQAVSAENRQREQEFIARRNEQQALLNSAQQALAEAERRSDQLKAAYDANEQTLTDLTETLRVRTGDIGELFGVVRLAAGEALGMVQGSIITTQKPDRGQIAGVLAEADGLPSIAQLRELQFLLLEEMAASSSVEKFTTEISASGGAKTQGEVVRVGAFNVVNSDGFLTFSNETGGLQVLDPQPAARFTGPAKSLVSASAGTLVEFPIDPSGGTLLSLETKKATVGERISQGGPVGYVIIGIGIIGIGIALWRLLILSGLGGKMKRQLKGGEPKPDNPLGRVLGVYAENRNADFETLELKLDEAIMKEVPPLESGQSLIKVFAAVAPLLGLLGTVVGMINTFQAITLFGTGDPKLMAGGISEALVTTMLGLIVAIPLVFMHTLVTSRSRSLIEVLEEQSAGIIARHTERT
ncbi:MAG: MotA/TolQ/ExbB proton channel family protein [Pseudomonadota bacterium]